MSKDKRRKRYFQGMEHLQSEVEKSHDNPHLERPGQAEATAPIEHEYIRKDLRGVIIIMSIIVLILAGLTIIDKKTDKLQNLAERVTSVIIK
jgi:hypothetical protein